MTHLPSSKSALTHETQWQGSKLVIGGGLAALLCTLLSGCSMSNTLPGETTKAAAGIRLTGKVHGGQQPISGATLQLYAAGNTGYGSAYTYTAGTSLLGSTPVTTDANGGFIITGDYTCPSAATPVYLVATGGSPGLVGQTNANSAIMAALGPCGNLTPSTSILIDEVTTVASVWALSHFMTGIANIGTSATNAAGLTNAFAAVNSVVNIAAGVTPGPALPAGATLPTAKINTLADVLAACINSAGGHAGDNTNCGILFSATTYGGVAPTDTITAAMIMAQHPNLNVATLTNMASPSSPFQPALATAPSDMNIVISYSAGGLATPQSVAVDPSGNVWIANANGNSVTEMTNGGTLLSGSSGYTASTLNKPSSIAIDVNGNAWIANRGNSTVSEVTSSGGTGNVYSGGNMSTPSGIAIDAYNNVWVSNYGNSSVTKVGSTGTVTNYTTSGVASPVGIAINSK